MIVSLGELAETAKKATIGCGHPYGIAEEMAFAVRWLCERGLHGTEKLVHSLEQPIDAVPRIDYGEDELRIAATAGKALASPTLSPSVAELLLARRTTRITVAALAHPLLLLPFAARAAALADATVSASWRNVDGESVTAVCEPQATRVHAPNPFALVQALGERVSCSWGEEPSPPPLLYTAEQLLTRRDGAIARGCQVNDNVWRKLQAFAHNTYVPVSEASRLGGAGAGLTDND